MTWAKYGNEFCARMRQRRLSDAARATHFEAIHYLYQVEQSDCRFYKDMLPVVAASPHRDSAVQELIRAGYWRDVGECFEVIDHGDVLRQSLVAQTNKLARDRRAKAKHRGKVESGSASSDADGSADGDDATDRQSDSREVEEPPHVPEQASEPWPEVTLPGARDTWRKAARGYED